MDGKAEIVAALLPGARMVEPDAVEAAPGEGGAYALFLELAAPLDFARGRLTHRFEPGFYVYAGSAFGPGGIRARLRRHFRREKARRWHIDDLTGAARRMQALAIVGGSECDVAARLAASGWFAHPLGGFGSSDCAGCPSHLLRYGAQQQRPPPLPP